MIIVILSLRSVYYLPGQSEGLIHWIISRAHVAGGLRKKQQLNLAHVIMIWILANISAAMSFSDLSDMCQCSANMKDIQTLIS